MKRYELIKKVTEELKHIPSGSFDQNMLRACYNMLRRHDLGLNPEYPRKETLVRSIETVREDKPDFLPIYDKEFFQT